MALKILIDSLRTANSTLKKCDEVEEKLNMEQLDLDQQQMDLNARKEENELARDEALSQKEEVRSRISDAMEEAGSRINTLLDNQYGLYCAYNMGDNSLEIREQSADDDTLLITLELYQDGLRAKSGEPFKVPSSPVAQMFFFNKMPEILSI